MKIKTPDAKTANTRPALTLILGPAGSGKTEWALHRLETCLRDGQRGLLIVSSPQQAQTRAEQLAARLSLPADEILPCMVTFRQLVARLIEDRETEDEDALPMGAIGRAFQRLALTNLFPNHIRADDFLGRMLRAPGFVPAFAERLREWKLACLTPDLLEQSGPVVAEALADPTFARKTEELARLYRAYETFLADHQLRDEEDCLRLAVEGIHSGYAALPPQTSCIVVDGFYRYNAMQRHLLAALASHVPSAQEQPPIEVAVTLPYESRRPLLFAAPARTLALLQQEFACRETHLTCTPPTRPPALALLSDLLFAPEEARNTAGQGTGNREQGTEGNAERGMMSDELNSHSSLITQHSALPNTQHPPLQLFDAPNPYVEAEMVARAFRRLYDTGRYAWSDFAVILRAMGDYAPILAAVFERHAIPLGIDGPEVLAENPFLKTLLHFLNVVRHNWQRDDVLAFLKSSYTAPDKIEADSLRRHARQSGVREGRERWLTLSEGSGVRGQGSGEEEKKRRREEEKTGNNAERGMMNDEYNPEFHSALSTHHSALATTLLDMAHYDALLTRERQDPRRFALLMEEIVAHFGMYERITQGEQTRQHRDRAAWQAAQDVLGALAQMAALSGRQAMTFEAFHDELLATWKTASSTATAEGDRVRVAEPYDTRERPLKVAAVMGLTERVFPRRITEDPFLRDAERIALRECAGLDLEEQKGRADDERFFFYLAVTAPSERLILSYPRSADESDTLPSFYLDEVRAVFGEQEAEDITTENTEDTEGRRQTTGNTGGTGEDRGKWKAALAGSDRPSTINYQLSTINIVSRTLADVAPRPDEVISGKDKLLAACAMLFDPGTGRIADADWHNAVTLMQACLAGEADRLTAQRVVASRELPRLPRLEADRLRRQFANHRAVFSVTELESYGRCPFQYFMRHVLRLRLEEEGIAARTQGTIYHAVLHRYFVAKKTEKQGKGKREKGKEETQSTIENRKSKIENPSTREALQRILAEMLAQEQMDVGLHQKQMTRRLLSDALDGFVAREERFQTQFGMNPTHFELSFGVGTRPDWEDEEERQLEYGLGEQENADTSATALCDAASCAEPLLLNVADGGPPVAICGTLDRVDLDATGMRALVMDYKMGKPPTFADAQRGQSLQMPLYLLAIERVFNKVGAVACYDSAQERGRRRFHRSEHVSSRQFAPLAPLEDGTSVTPLNRSQYADLLKTAEATAVRLARSIVAGNIEATPGDHCRFCAYGDVCRTSALGGHDGETLPIIPSQPTQTTRGQF